jgi:pimeloyl-ACP methyl ester carboxylesterase
MVRLKTKKVRVKRRSIIMPQYIFNKIHFHCTVVILLLWLISHAAQANPAWPSLAISEDGTPIAYEVYGSGDPTLVLVHGWSCDGRYWREQIDTFSSRHRVVTIDLAGHGHSGLDRHRYTMSAFGQDVVAVVEALDADPVILIGHSMGGPVIAQAAGLMPERVRGLIGVDTYQNVESMLSEEEMEAWLAPLRADFRGHGAGFVAAMFLSETDQDLRDWVIADMTAAPPEVALSAMTQMLEDYTSGKAASAFAGLEIPVRTINADLWPTDIEANRRHIEDFEATIMENTDHFLMMNQPERFNSRLADTIKEILDQD